MPPKAVALFSGGLDSMLAVKVMQQQGIEVESLNFRTQFNCCKDEASRAANALGIRVTLVSTDDAYLRLVEKPRFGYGRAVNPCSDCRIYMFERAAKMMAAVGASFIVSGEVVGQRPNSQMRGQLQRIERGANLAGLILRPLSAKLLPPTKPELEGVVDRQRLHGFSGRSRKGLMDLARAFGIHDIPTPSTGCILTEKEFGKRVRDLWSHQSQYDRWDYEALKVGRHLRLPGGHKIVIARDQEEGWLLESLHSRRTEGTALFLPANFNGPTGLLVLSQAARAGSSAPAAIAPAPGVVEDEPSVRRRALALLLAWSKKAEPDNALYVVRSAAGEEEVRAPSPAPRADATPLLV
ncbi:MAG: hypothetical protein HY719_12510 [Planctomycetes bacterium]|nr:hypothetical protein [Planctomycetota bacterium]